MKTFLSRNRYTLILALIIISQLCYTTYMFCQREGWHIDEAWSYEFANANHQVGIYFDEKENVINYGEWLDSSVFKDYIEVQDGGAFHFSDAYYNCTANHNNPPLYNMILHAVCSFFPNTFSWWFSYFINVISFIIAMLALYALSKEINNSPAVALIACAFYGSTTAALNTFIFLRMYALLTALVILLFYVHSRLYNKNFKKPALCYISLFILVVVGGSTQYIYLFLGFCITTIFSLFLIAGRKWKVLLGYCSTMASAAITVFLLWPYDLEKFTTPSLYGAEMPYIWEVKYCLQCVFNETLGIRIPFLNPLRKAILLVIFIYALIIISGICFILRKNSRFKNFIRSLYTSTILWFKKLPIRLQKMNKLYLLFTFTWITTLLIIAKTCNIFIMSVYADRYLFCLFPIVSSLFVCILFKCIQYIHMRHFKKNRIFTVVSLALTLVALIIINHINYPCNYLFERNCDDPVISDIVKDSNVILVTKAPGNLPYYPPLFLDTKQFFVTSPFDDIDATLESMNRLNDTSSSVYLIAETSIFLSEDYQRNESSEKDTYDLEGALSCQYKLSEFLDKIASCKWVTELKYIQTEDSFKGPLAVYKLR